MSSQPFSLQRNPFGRLVWTDAQGQTHEGVLPVRAFPIAAPNEGISLVGTDGRERVWIERLDHLPTEARQLIEDELSRREFMPVIQRIREVSTYSTPSIWQIDTDRGTTTLTLKGEEDIRRLPGHGLLIADSQGMHFLIRDRTALDRHTKRILERFL